MAYYNTCPLCGANLDPGEECECVKEKSTGEEKNAPAGGSAAAGAKSIINKIYRQYSTNQERFEELLRENAHFYENPYQKIIGKAALRALHAGRNLKDAGGLHR